MKQYYVYILANEKRGTLYTGITNNLRRRAYEHKNDIIEGFTKKYRVHRLVYFERFRDVRAAIFREKQIKAWKRQWKVKMIEMCNPCWEDLFETEDALVSFLRRQESIVCAKTVDSKSSLE